MANITDQINDRQRNAIMGLIGDCFDRIILQTHKRRRKWHTSQYEKNQKIQRKTAHAKYGYNQSFKPSTNARRSIQEFQLTCCYQWQI